MLLKIIASNVLTRELGYLSSCCPHAVETIWLRQDRCGNPDQMRNVLQAYVDELEDEGICDAILLATGLCGGAVWGVRSRRVPLIVPRVHDCVGLLLGGSGRYRDIFEEHEEELLWLSPGIIEYGYDRSIQEEDDTWSNCITHRYDRAAYVQLPTVHYPDFRGQAQTCAASQGLELAEYGGDDGLLRDLLAARWDENRFLVIPPERTCEPSYDYRILKLED